MINPHVVIPGISSVMPKVYTKGVSTPPSQETRTSGSSSGQNSKRGFDSATLDYDPNHPRTREPIDVVQRFKDALPWLPDIVFEEWVPAVEDFLNKEDGTLNYDALNFDWGQGSDSVHTALPWTDTDIPFDIGTRIGRLVNIPIRTTSNFFRTMVTGKPATILQAVGAAKGGNIEETAKFAAGDIVKDWWHSTDAAEQRHLDFWEGIRSTAFPNIPAAVDRTQPPDFSTFDINQEFEKPEIIPGVRGLNSFEFLKNYNLTDEGKEYAKEWVQNSQMVSTVMGGLGALGLGRALPTTLSAFFLGKQIGKATNDSGDVTVVTTDGDDSQVTNDDSEKEDKTKTEDEDNTYVPQTSLPRFGTASTANKEGLGGGAGGETSHVCPPGHIWDPKVGQCVKLNDLGSKGRDLRTAARKVNDN